MVRPDDADERDPGGGGEAARRVLKLVRLWLEAGVMEDGQATATLSGTPLARLKLELHPEKTRRVDLSRGRQGFDFLGCHLRKRMSGPIWARERRRVFFLQRCPSQRSMKRVRQRVKEMTGRNLADPGLGLLARPRGPAEDHEVVCVEHELAQVGVPPLPQLVEDGEIDVRQQRRDHAALGRNGVKDVRVIIREINPVLRGWGNYFGTGNAAKKFNQLDAYVVSRLRRFMVKRKGRNLRAGESDGWTHDFFHEHGLYRLRGTVKYPEAA